MIGIDSTTNRDSAADALDEHERLANLDLALHQVEHSLRVPHTLQYDRFGARPGFTVIVSSEHADAWLESIAVDSHTTKPIDKPALVALFPVATELHIVEGRLPVQGVRITLRFYAPASPARLQAVGA